MTVGTRQGRSQQISSRRHCEGAHPLFRGRDLLRCRYGAVHGQFGLHDGYARSRFVSISALHVSNQVTVAAASDPPGHRLMGMAMEYFIGLGEEAGTGPVLVGPHGFAKVVDMYLREIGVDQPSIWEDNNGSIRLERFWATEIADLRFTGGLFHPLTACFTWASARGLAGATD